MKTPRWTDHEVEQAIGRVLQVGVLVAAAVAIGGAVGMLAQYTRPAADFHVFRADSSPLWSLRGIGRGAASGDGRAIAQLAIVLLIATPVARVALTLGAFILQRDRLYAAMTTVVFVLLLSSLLWGGVR